MFRSVMRRVGRALRAVIHDPEVQRGARGLAVLVIIRLALAVGASAQLVEMLRPVVEKFFGV